MDYVKTKEETVRDYFLRLCNKKSGDEEQRGLEGVRVFKRKVLGLCGIQATKSLEDLVFLFNRIGLSKSVVDGIRIIHKIKDTAMHYTKEGDYILITEIPESRGNLFEVSALFDKDYFLSKNPDLPN